MRTHTLAVRGGSTLDPQTGAVSFPIYQTSTYTMPGAGTPRTFQGRSLGYARTENPTRTALETTLARLENAKYGIAFSSGLAAINSVLHLLKSGDHVIVSRDLYAGVFQQFTRLISGFGIEVDFVELTDLEALRAAIQPRTRMVWVETPSNPTLAITDIAEVAAIAKQQDMLTVVDSTFATPILQRPLEMGADVVVHSATKYINGHADVISGVVATNDSGLADEIRFVQDIAGAVPSPMDCFLVARGLQTLALRMERHSENALKLAMVLEANEHVARVRYPGLDSDPGHEVAKRQMTGFGGMVSFELKGPASDAILLLNNLNHFDLATSLGGVRSMICHPASMTHSSMTPEQRFDSGLPDGLIRMSVGLEDVEDLIEDLDQAIKQVYRRTTSYVHSPLVPSPAAARAASLKRL